MRGIVKRICLRCGFCEIFTRKTNYVRFCVNCRLFFLKEAKEKERQEIRLKKRILKRTEYNKKGVSYIYPLLTIRDL